MNTKAKPQDTQ